MLLFKTARVEAEWSSGPVDPGLRLLIEFLVSEAERRFGKDVKLTCVYRSPAEDAELYHDPTHQPGVHCHWRGADVSVLNFGWLEVKALCKEGNYRWNYDPDRLWLKCFLFETGGGGATAPHIHVQSNPLTTVALDRLVGSEAGQVL